MKKANQIILIDDDSITNFLHENIINRMSITKEVVTLESAEEALEYISQSFPPHKQDIPEPVIILLDINMPGMNGFEFLEVLSTQYFSQQFKIFMVSSSQNARDVENAKKHPICGYTTKPLTEQKILGIMKKAQEDKLCLCG